MKAVGYSVKSETANDVTATTERLYLFDTGESGEGITVIGIDEAGRGPLAGPVVAAAVALKLSERIDGINDSKKVPAKKRELLFDVIAAQAAGWAVGTATPEEIDRINILEATYLAMHRAVCALGVSWDLALVDGNRKIPQLPAGSQKTIVGGDACSASIAAASICAKVTRDRVMADYHTKYPEYQFDKHKGYGTALHRENITKYGICEIHRKSFCNNLIMQTRLEL